MIRLIVIILFFLLSVVRYNFAQDFWEQTGLVSIDVNSIAINSNGDIFAGTNQGIYLSTDNGDNWTLTDLLNGTHSLAINSIGDIFAGTFSNGIYRSTDNGDNWTQINTGMVGYVLDIVINSINGDIFTANCDYGIAFVCHSTDNGNNWNCYTGGICARSIAINNIGHIFAGTDYDLYRSTDNGDNWTQTYLLNGANSLAINSIGDIFAGTASNFIYRSSDNGDSWIQLNNGLTNNNIVKAISINSKGDIFAGTQGDGVFRSKDNGDYWTQINNGLTNTDVRALVFNSNGYIFAGTNGGGVYKSINSTTSIKDNPAIKNFKLQNYPNPFKSKTDIYYTVPAGYNDNIKITVFNINGTKIKELVNNVYKEGNYSVTFNTEYLSSGIYYYTINCKNYIQTKKMILIK